MSRNVKRWLLLILVAGAVYALDQSVKHLVVTRLQLGESWDAIPAISHFIRVTRSYNTGAAFGILPSASPVFLVVALVTAGVFICLYPTFPNEARLSRIGIAMVLGGALSNATDRLRFEHVIDYVHVQVTSNFANISNFADHAIFVGVMILLIEQWIFERRHLAAEQALESAEETGELAQNVAYPDDSIPSDKAREFSPD